VEDGSVIQALREGTKLQGGKYLIQSALGNGGFGVTYRAQHSKLRQDVVIKEFYPQSMASRGADGGLVPRPGQEMLVAHGVKTFVNEGRSIANVNHPNVVRVNDFFEENRTGYLVMPYVPSVTLRALLNEAGPMPEDNVRQLIGRLVSALRAVHKQGVYHLDLKPENVLVTPRQEPILIDFGAARVAARRGQLAEPDGPQSLTLAYAPPELLYGEPAGPTTDLFELALVAYELLTAQHAPPAKLRLQVVAAGDVDWEPNGVSADWYRLLLPATRLKPVERPESLKKWWNSFGQPAEPARPTVPPVREGKLRLDPRFKLSEVLPDLPEDTTVELEPGTYTVGSCSVAKTLHIRGVGPDPSELRGQFVVTPSGALQLDSVNLDGNDEAQAIHVMAGKCELVECHIDGSIALQVDEGTASVKASWLTGSSIALLGSNANVAISEDCDLQGELCSIAVVGGELFVAESSIGSDDFGGLSLQSNSRARLTGVKVNAAGAALEITGASRLHLSDSVVTSKSVGLRVTDSAEVLIDDTRIEGCGENGVVVDGDGEVAANKTAVSACGGHGMLFSGAARLRGSGSQIIGNAKSGLSLTDSAQAQVRSYGFLRNGSVGVNFDSEKNLTLLGGEINCNAHEGLTARNQGRVLLSKTAIEDNGSTGVSVRGQVRLKLRGLEVTSSGVYGVRASEKAKLSIDRCRVEASSRSGLRLEGESRGTFSSCHVTGNRGNGVSVYEQASIWAESSYVTGNDKSGIYVKGKHATALLFSANVSSNGYHGVEARLGGQVRLQRCKVEVNHGRDVSTDRASAVQSVPLADEHQASNLQSA
jgi:serine/threonine protein kinase